MSHDEAPAKPDALQFDRVETDATRPTTSDSGPEVTCSVCGKSVGDEYFHINGKSVCANCRDMVTAAAQTPRDTGALIKSGLLGVGAAIAGAAIYYGVIALTNFEIGLVAILIGYMVGWAVRKGAAGRGGRRFQVLALVLTYWAVGLAYTPLAFKGMKEGRQAASRDSTAAASGDSASADADGPSDAADSIGAPAKDDAPSSGRDVLLAFGMFFVFVFALPVLYIVGSLPGGLLSALIIGIGLRQAWVMTGAAVLEISGPYKVGAGEAPVPGTL